MRFPKECSWRFKPSGIQCCVFGQALPTKVSKDHRIPILLELHDHEFYGIKILWTHPMPQHQIPGHFTLWHHKYTGCPRRNGQNSGRVFLMLNYTDITQNTYIQSWTVTEIMAWEKCGHLAFPRTVHLQLSCIDLDSAIKAVISVTARALPNAIRQYFITARYSCTM